MVMLDQAGGGGGHDGLRLSGRSICSTSRQSRVPVSALQPGMRAHTCHPCTREVEAEGSGFQG